MGLDLSGPLSRPFDMRDPVGAELLLFARALTLFPREERVAVASLVLAEVEAGHRLLHVSGRCHPVFGDGSLMSRCALFPLRPEPLAHDEDFLSAMVVACNALLGHSRS